MIRRVRKKGGVFMDYSAVNNMAVLVAGVAGFIIGWLWYAPFLFGKAWARMMGMGQDAMKGGMAKGIIGGLIASIVMAYVLAYLIVLAGAVSTGMVLQLAFWIWLGFLATAMLGMVLWEKKPIGLYLINVFHYLVVLGVMGWILVAWK